LNRINGWIFDVYADEQGMVVWVIDPEGVAHQVRDTLAPSFFVFGPQADLHEVCVNLSAARLPVRLRRAVRHDLFLRRDLTVLEVQVLRPLLFASIFARVRTFRPALNYYNADLSPVQFYYFEKNLFPLAYCEIQTNAAGWITDLEVKDSRWDLEYRLPPLRRMSVRLAGQAANPNHGFRGGLEIQAEDRVCVLDASDPRELLLTLSRLLQKL
jgi:hypothetical protein